MSQPSYSEIKVQARQALVNADKPNADFTVPSGNYDLSQCYIQVSGRADNSMTVETNYTNPVPSQAAVVENRVYDDVVSSSDSAQAGLQFLTYAVKDNLIRNAYAESSKLGYLDNVAYHNSWKQNLDAAIYNEDELNSFLEYGGSRNTEQHGLVRSGPVNMISKVDSEPSVKKEFKIRLPLKNIFPSHEIKNYQTSVHGDLSYHFETRLGNLSTSFNNGVLDYTTQYNSNADSNNNGQYRQLDSFTNNSGAPVEITHRESLIHYDSLQDVPFHISQPVQITYTTLSGGTTSPVQTVNTTIKSMSLTSFVGAYKKCRFDFNSSSICTLANNSTIQTIFMTPINPTSQTLTIDNVELLMMTVNNPPPIKLPQQIPLRYIANSKDNIPIAQAANKTFYIPPNTDSLFVVFPEVGDGTFSSFELDDLTSYRFVIDNKPVADGKLIKVKSGKHYDLFNRALSSAGLRPASIKPYFRNFNFSNDGSLNQIKEILIIGCPVVNSSQQQALQIELNAGANFTGNIQVVYYRNKVVNV